MKLYTFKKSMRISKYLLSGFGLICLFGCQGTDIRDTNVRNKTNNIGSSIKDTDILEEKKEDTFFRESINKRDKPGSENILVEVPVKEAEKTKNISDKLPVLYDETGIASFISDEYDGRMTASGVRYDRNKMTAAHPSLPFDTKVLVTNLRNNKTVEVTIIDRFTPAGDRILNLSYNAAVQLDLVECGVIKAGIKIISNTD